MYVSANILQQSYCQQVDIRMHSHGLRQLVDDTSVASCQQTFCKFIVKTFYPQLGATSSMTDILYCTLMKRTNLLELLTSCNKLAKFATSVTFLDVRACRAVARALIRGVYIHIFRFYPTSFF